MYTQDVVKKELLFVNYVRTGVGDERMNQFGKQPKPRDLI
jgi:hypothetical protein